MLKASTKRIVLKAPKTRIAKRTSLHGGACTLGSKPVTNGSEDVGGKEADLGSLVESGGQRRPQLQQLLRTPWRPFSGILALWLCFATVRSAPDLHYRPREHAGAGGVECCRVPAMTLVVLGPRCVI